MKDKLKVIEFISSLHHGGAETLVKLYASMMDKERFDVIVMTTAGSTNNANEQELKKNGIPTVFIGDRYHQFGFVGKALCKMMRIRNIEKVIEKEKPDVIHCHLGAVKYIAEICKKHRLDCKLVFTVHCELERQLAMPGIGDAVNYLVKNHDMKIIALHKKMQQQLKELYGQSCMVLNNGTDLSRYELPSDTRQKKRMELNIPQNAFVLGHVGRFIEAKNHRFLIDIFAELKRLNADSRLVMVGDGELRASISHYVEEKGLQDSVIFTGLRGDIPELLKMMDVFCLPSFTEGVPVTVVEAQAANVPCLISDVVVEDVVLTEKIERLSLNKAADEWARKVLQFGPSTDRDDIDARLLEFDIHRVIRKLEDYYEEFAR